VRHCCSRATPALLIINDAFASSSSDRHEFSVTKIFGGLGKLSNRLVSGYGVCGIVINMNVTCGARDRAHALDRIRKSAGGPPARLLIRFLVEVQRHAGVGVPWASLRH